MSVYRYLTNFTWVGVAALESSTGKLFAASHQFNQFAGGPNVVVRTDTATSLAAFPSETTQSLRLAIEFPNYWKLQSDGTNIYAYTSFDGENWDLENQMALSSAFTAAPDRVGIFVIPWNADGTARPVTVYCYDFTIS